MPAYPIPPDETERLSLLHALNILDTPPEPVFDRVTRLVARILDVPIAVISLVDADRQWFKSRVGLTVTQTPRDVAFCAHAIMQSEALVVPDASADARFCSNPLVLGEPNIRFYAGVPLRSADGLAIGTLCAIDTRPRFLTPEEAELLDDLADLANREIQLRESVLLSRRHISESAHAIAAVEARFRTVFERAGAGIALIARDGHCLSANEALCEIVGYSQEELARLAFQDITHPEDLDSGLSLLRQLGNNEIDRYDLEKRYITKSGAAVWISLTVTKQIGARGNLEYFVAIIKNIQARKEAEAALAELHKDLEDRVRVRTAALREANAKLSAAMEQQLMSERALRKREAELRMVIENANDAYVCIDQAGVVLDWNRQAEQTFGWSAQEAVGGLLADLIIPAAMREAHRAGMRRYLEAGVHKVLHQRMELTALRRNGQSLPVEVRICPLLIDGQYIFSAFLHDITERKKLEARREHDARHDALTGLANRRGLFDLLPHAIARSQRNGALMALLFVDLDGFKLVNDTHGHQAGDLVLCEVAARMNANIRKTDTVTRLGGDEFTVVLENLAGDGGDAHDVAQKILLAIRQPIELYGTVVAISASIGITLHQPEDGSTPDQLVSRADSAMYEAKRAGKSRVCGHDVAAG